jgi:hypothetical protein
LQAISASQKPGGGCYLPQNVINRKWHVPVIRIARWGVCTDKWIGLQRLFEPFGGNGRGNDGKFDTHGA